MLAATLKQILLECYLPRQSDQILAAVRIGFECRCNGQNLCRFNP